MDKEKLYEILDIETPEDFQYFENIAALMECEEDIPYELMCKLVDEVDEDTLAGLVDEYIDDVTDHIPEGETDVYILLENFKRNLVDLREGVSKDEKNRDIADELDRFRRFYSMGSIVYVTNQKTHHNDTVTLAQAIMLSRMENLNFDKYTYDFRECKYE